MSSINIKITLAIAVVLAIVLFAIAAALFSTQTAGERRFAQVQNYALTDLLIKSIEFSMGGGIFDVSPLESDLNEMDGVVDFRVVSSEKLKGESDVILDDEERQILAGGDDIISTSVLEDGTPTMRIVRPLSVGKSCLQCHPQFEEGEPMSAVSLVLSQAESRAQSRRNLTLVVVFFVVAVFVLIAALFFILKRLVVSPVSGLRDIMKEIAEGEGDLTKRMAVKNRDEIGQTARWLDVFLERLQNMVVSIKDSSVQNTSISDDLMQSVTQSKHASRQIADGIEKMKGQVTSLTEKNTSTSGAVAEILGTITNLTSQIEEQSSSVAQTSAAIEEMAAAVSSVSRISQDNVGSAEKLLALTSSGDEKVRATNTNINAISKNVDDLLELISLINNIASQTNLLSMNAAIEAAHAGEFGKGFAVVADEIKHLAESTAENAKTITGSLEEIIDKIQVSLDASAQSGEAFGQIQESVRTVVDSFSEIASSTDELKNGSNEILHSSTELMNITETIKSQAQDIRGRAEDINSAAKEMAQISQTVDEGVSEISNEATGIAAESEWVEEISRKNADNASNLTKDVELFKTE